MPAFRLVCFNERQCLKFSPVAGVGPESLREQFVERFERSAGVFGGGGAAT